jgi:hypothetical protein
MKTNRQQQVRRIQMQFYSVKDLQLFRDSLRNLGCSLYERKASDNAASPTFQIHRGSESVNQTGNKTTQKASKRPPRQRTTSTQKKSRAPMLPALPLINLDNSTESLTLGSSSTIFQTRDQNQMVDRAQHTTVLSNSPASARTDRHNIAYPLPQSVSSHTLEHERNEPPSLSSHTLQHERNDHFSSEVMRGGRSPAININSDDLPTEKSTTFTGNVGYMERLAQNTEELPPRRHLPFVRSSDSSELGRAATSPLSYSALNSPSTGSKSSQRKQLPEERREGQVLPSVTNRADQRFGPPARLVDLPTETLPSAAQPSESFTQQASHRLQSLKGYTAVPEDQRFEIVEAGIIFCLKDNNFVQFCEDLYNAWPRIGLDLENLSVTGA